MCSVLIVTLIMMANYDPLMDIGFPTPKTFWSLHELEPYIHMSSNQGLTLVALHVNKKKNMFKG